MSDIHALDHPTCERLLRRGAFGRFALVSPRGPEIVPLNYVVDDDAIVVHTDPAGLLARHGVGADLIFEIDAVDPEYWQGFSVIARGTGMVVDEHARASEAIHPRPWAGGDRSLEFKMPWTELTGRQVGHGSLESFALFGRAQS